MSSSTLHVLTTVFSLNATCSAMLGYTPLVITIIIIIIIIIAAAAADVAFQWCFDANQIKSNQSCLREP